MTPTEKPVEIVLDHVDDAKSLANTQLTKYFQAAIQHGASDLIMRSGQKPKLRMRGELKNMDVEDLDHSMFEHAIEEGLSEVQWTRYSHEGSVDLAVDFPANDKPDAPTTRFRVNIFRTRGRSGIAARLVSNEIYDFEKLLLPDILREVTERTHQGLILLCGVTGSGKSTTIASMLNHINKLRRCHILTIEDPIEYLFSDDKAIINQREIGIDVPSFAIALRAMVRENPDVVLVGELRDRETFEAALQASETGHLVFGTIHASSASQAFGRIYDLFPVEEREGIRNLLAYQMQAFVYQKLMPTLHKDIARVPAVEILLQSSPTRKFIMDGREHELEEVIKNHRQDGMQTFTDSLADLVHREYVHPKVAQAAAFNPEELKMRLRGIG